MAEDNKQEGKPEDLLNLTAKREEFLDNFFKRGAHFTTELLGEIDSLRRKVSKLSEENADLRTHLASDDAIRDLLAKIENLEEEKRKLRTRMRDADDESRNYVDRYSVVEAELDSMANLYVASFQLHSTLAPDGVLSVLEQMLMQFVGAASFAIFLRQPVKGEDLLVPVHAFHYDNVQGTTVPWNEGLIGESAATQISHVGDPSIRREDSEPLACIPMVLGNETVGVIVIYQLLEQKEKFVEIDYELFKLLALHSASAIIGAGLFSQTGGIAASLREYKRL